MKARTWIWKRESEEGKWYLLDGQRSDEQFFYLKVQNDQAGYRERGRKWFDTLLDARCTCGLPEVECLLHDKDLKLKTTRVEVERIS